MSQLLTLFWLRYVVFRNSMGGRREFVSTLLRLVFITGYLLLSVGTGVALFLIMVLMPDSVGNLLAGSMGMIFGMLLFLTLVTQATGTSANFDPRRFILFPLNLKKLFALNLASAFSELVLITLLPSVAGILIGRGVALGHTLAGCLVFVLATLWIDALFVLVALLTAWLLSGRKRRTEIFFTVLMGMFLVSGQLLPRLLATSLGDGVRGWLQPWQKLIGDVLAWTPFGVWQEFFVILARQDALAAFRHLLPVSLVWTGLAWLAGYAVFVRLAKSAPAGTSRTTRADDSAEPAHLLSLKLPFVSEQLSVIVARELTYLMRNTVTWLNTVNILVIGLLALSPARLSMRGRSPGSWQPEESFTLPGAFPWGELWWLLMLTGFTLLVNFQYFSAIFAFDGSGFRQYLLTPVRWRRILLGKNLAIGMLVAGQITLILLGTILLYGPVPGGRLFLLFCTAITAMVVFTLAGNALSIHFPYPAEFGIRRRRSQNSYGTISFIVLLVLVLLLGLMLALPLLAGWLLMSSVVKYATGAGMALLACLVYLFQVKQQSHTLEAKQFDISEALTRRAAKI